MRLHPVTGEDMGTATYMQAYLLLSALFVAVRSRCARWLYGTPTKLLEVLTRGPE